MFKVECLGCQAPYQVDEKRVPEKGLKMRCPKCGTSFKVEAPAPGNAATPAPPEATTTAATPAAAAAPAPVSAQRAFSSTALGASKPFGKAPAGRESLARTMIGVSSADLGLALGPAPGAPTDPTKSKGFRIPRPNAGADTPASPTTSAAEAVEGPPVPFGLEPSASRVESAAALPAAVREVDLPAVVGAEQPSAPSAEEADLPASSTNWNFHEATAEAAPESLVEPSAPLRLSELPQPVAQPAPKRARPGPSAANEADAIPPLELDFGDDLPVAAPRARRPPPRRARAPGPATPAEATQPSAFTNPEEADLPARLEDLEAGLPEAVVPRARPEPAAAPRAPAARAKSSSLDELDLPAIAPREEPGGGLPARVAPKPIGDLERAPNVTSPKARSASDIDLPAVASAAAVPARVRRPAVSDLPDILGAGLPEVSGADLPALQGAGLPDILGAGLPEFAGAGLPAVQSAGLPEVVVAGLPEVAAGLPVVSAVGLPDVLQSGLPGLTNTGLPEVSGRGVAGFGRIDLPLAREAGLPEVRGPGLGPVDLPSVGDALPALAGGPEWDEVTQSGTDAVPADADPFGSASADEDPFAGSEADFGAAREADPFGAPLENTWGDGATRGPAEEPRSDAGYGEVDIASGVSGAALETAEDMEFSAIPERSEAPSGGRAAAHANVHGEGADSEANGSTLELGPQRRPPSRRRSRRLALALGVCGLVIAGGALSLEPRLGPFGAHFILDQVHRPQHEKLLADLVTDSRRSGALDTFDAAVAALDRLEGGRQTAPRYEPLLARSAYAHYEVALRFGPLPKLEAAGKAEIDRLNPNSTAPTDRLARAARAALAHTTDAQHELEALGPDADARELLGELLLGAEDWPAAVQLWTERVQAEPQSSRALFGLARAELGAGNATQASVDVGRVIALNPDHVGARVLALEAKRAIDDSKAGRGPDAASTEDLVAAINKVLPHASPGEGALAHSVLGELHSSQGRAAPAQQAFEEALAIDGNFPRALIGLGETLEITGRHAEALARFEAAAHLQPNSLPAQLGMAKAQIQLGHLPDAKVLLAALLEKHPADPGILYWRGRAEQAAGDNDAAFASYKASIAGGQRRADSVAAYLALAKLQADLGQLAAAQTTLAEAREKLPPSGELNKALGEIDMTRGEYVDAYAHFQQALALDSNDTRARFLSAVALTRLGRFDEALNAFQTVGETDKDFPGLAVERGRLFEESGKNDQALREYEAAFARSPDDLEVQTRVGCARVVAGKGKEAEDLLEKLTRARPRSAEASYCLGRALFEEERLIDASQRLERAVELDSTRAIYYLYLAWVESELGRNSDAEVALGHALDLDKGLGDAYWQRGRLRQKQGAVKDAIRDLEHALQLKPSRFEALADLASAYADLGRMPEALKAWEEAIARDPDNATWHFRYGKLLSSSGNGTVAAAHLRRAIDLLSETKDEKAAGNGEKPKAPVWLWQAQYLLARELGHVAASIPHWQAYLRLAPADDPYRHEAERALAALGQPWDQR